MKTIEVVHSLESYPASSNSMKVSQQGESFLVSLRLISQCLTIKMGGVFITISYVEEPRAMAMSYVAMSASESYLTKCSGDVVSDTEISLNSPCLLEADIVYHALLMRKLLVLY